jgi:hypothetical protein
MKSLLHNLDTRKVWTLRSGYVTPPERALGTQWPEEASRLLSRSVKAQSV